MYKENNVKKIIGKDNAQPTIAQPSAGSDDVFDDADKDRRRGAADPQEDDGKQGDTIKSDEPEKVIEVLTPTSVPLDSAGQDAMSDLEPADDQPLKYASLLYNLGLLDDAQLSSVEKKLKQKIADQAAEAARNVENVLNITAKGEADGDQDAG